MDSAACRRPERFGIGVVHMGHDRVNLPDPVVREARPCQRGRNAHELPGAERIRTTEVRLRTPGNEFAQSSYVVVMPVRRHDQANGPGRIHPKAIEVSEGHGDGDSPGSQERVQDDPITPADMHDGALTVSRPEQRYFHLVGTGSRVSLNQGSTWRAGGPPTPARPSSPARSGGAGPGIRFARHCSASRSRTSRTPSPSGRANRRTFEHDPLG